MFARRIALIALVPMLAGACSLERSGYQFVRSPSTGTYLKVPEDWTVHGQKDIQAFLAEAQPGTEPVSFPFLSVFDADADRELDFDVGADVPVGLVRVRDLSDGERDSVSYATARDEFNAALNDGLTSGEIPLRKAVEVTHESADGQRIVFTYTDPETGMISTLDQTTLIDRERRRIYLLVVGCEVACYEKHRKQIDTVVTSLTIKER